MSKFFNYVKKFLSLSFMSAVAAFSLSFNQMSAEDVDSSDMQSSVSSADDVSDEDDESVSSKSNGSGGYYVPTAGMYDTGLLAKFRDRTRSHVRPSSHQGGGPVARFASRMQNGRTGYDNDDYYAGMYNSSKILPGDLPQAKQNLAFGNRASYSNQLNLNSAADGYSHVPGGLTNMPSYPAPSNNASYSNQLNLNSTANESDDDSTSNVSAYKDAQDKNIYDIKIREDESGYLNLEAHWIGSALDGAVKIPATCQYDGGDEDSLTVPVVGIKLDRNVDGSKVSDITELTVDARNFADGAESIIIPDKSRMVSLKKVIVENAEEGDVSAMELSRSPFRKVLEKNSVNGLAAVYRFNDGENEKLVFESNLIPASINGGIADANGVTYSSDSASGTWKLMSFPNISTLVIPAAFVDQSLTLQKVDELALHNDIKTDKIEKLIVTNIQDDEQKEKIIKYAKLALTGLDDGINQTTDWLFSGNQDNGKTLIFEKIRRDTQTIIYETLLDIIQFLKGIDASDHITNRELADKLIRKIHDHFDYADQKGNAIGGIFAEIIDALAQNDGITRLHQAAVRIQEGLMSLGDSDYTYSDLDEDESSFSEPYKEMFDKRQCRCHEFVNEKIDIKCLEEKLNSILKELELDYSDDDASYYFDEDESEYAESSSSGANRLSLSRPDLQNNLENSDYSDGDFSSDESFSSGTGSLSLKSGTDNSSLTRPDPQNDLESSNAGEESSSSVSGSTKNTNNSSNVLGSSSSNSVNETNDNVSKLATIGQDWQNWLVGEGADKDPKEQYQELKNRINAVMDSLSDEEKAKAKKLIEEIDDTLAAMDTAATSSSGTSTGTSTTSASSTPSYSSSSAQTKTSDSGVSPELLSLILSGSLAGLGISLKKRDK